MDARFEGSEGGVDARFELEGRMAARFDAVEERIVRFDEVLSAKIDALGDRLEGVFRRELRDLCKELAAHTRTTVFACLGAVMTSGGLAFAAARL